MAEYEAGKTELFKFLNKESEKKRKNGPIVLALEIKHGDIVIMHGERIQEIHEHAVRPIIRTTRIHKVLQQIAEAPDDLSRSMKTFLNIYQTVDGREVARC